MARTDTGQNRCNIKGTSLWNDHIIMENSYTKITVEQMFKNMLETYM